MAFARRSLTVAPRSALEWAAAGFRGALSLGLRLISTAAVLCLIAAFVLALRLLQGPLEVPALGRYLAKQVTAQSDEVNVEARSMVLSLGDGRVPAGLEFRDVTVEAKTGEPLFAVPRISTSLRIPDLIQGRIRPVRLSIIEADAQFIRAPDGRIRFGLGKSGGVALAENIADETAKTSNAGLDAVRGFIDSFIGDAPPIDALTELERVEVLGANLIYVDRRDGGSWETRDAALRITRDAEGAKAVLRVDDIAKGTPGAALEVLAVRRKGAGATEVRAQFGRLDTAELARQLPDLGWLNALGATFEGAASLTIDDKGAVTTLQGEAIAERGVIRGADIPFDQIAVEFRYDPSTGHLVVDKGRMVAPMLDTEFDLAARLDTSMAGDVPGVYAQLGLRQLSFTDRALYPKPLTFQRGQVNLHWDADRGRIKIADGWLAEDDLVFRIDGQITNSEKGLVTDLRASAPKMDVRGLLAHWPKSTAANARTWVRDNIRRANITDIVAHIRLSDGEPDIALDFAFNRLVSRYIRGMTPIVAAEGAAHVTFNDMVLGLDAGRVLLAPGRSVDLTGSTFRISDFWADVTPAEIDLVANGPLQAILQLIDEKPLSLVSKLGADLSPLSGTAAVRSSIDFPLVQTLKVEDVKATASAVLSDVSGRMPIGKQKGKPIELASQAILLEADTTAMRLSGSLDLDGNAVLVAWEERYGDKKAGRTISAQGTLTSSVLARLGAGDLGVTGSAPLTLSLMQSGDEPLGFEMAADLTDAGLAIDALGWSKDAGQAGSLTAKGRYGGRLIVDTVALTTETLNLAGRVVLTPAGRLEEARLAKVSLPERMDLSATIRLARDGVPEIFLTGAYLDLSDSLDGDETNGQTTTADGQATSAEPVQDAKPGEPMRLRMDLKELKLSESLVLTPAKGRVSRRKGGAIDAEIAGQLGSDAPITLVLDLPIGKPGGIVLTSENAGEVLRAAGLYSDAQGGRLTLSAEIGGDGAPDLKGTVRIEDVRVRSKSTFRNALREGGMDSAQKRVENNGIGFRKIWIPFSYDEGVVTLTDAVAVSPILGLKLTGTLDEGKDELDMVGVMSPAYALTGAINDIPLLGKLLAGGEGEGILAMTFTLRGNSDDPNLTVNPLSLLAPGLLRRVFTAASGGSRGAAVPRQVERRGDNERALTSPAASKTKPPEVVATEPLEGLAPAAKTKKELKQERLEQRFGTGGKED